MSGADYLIIAILACSMLLGMFRGFVREAIGVIAWLGGLWLAWRYAPLVEPLLGGALADPPLSTWAARVIILIATVIAGWLVAGAVSYLLRHSALSVMVDRLLGLLFGLVRGAVVLAAILMLAQFARLDQVAWWKKSKLLPYASEYAGYVESFARTGMRLLDEQAQSAVQALPAPALRV